MKVYNILLKLVLHFHNFIYKLASKLSVKVEQGIHPKHRLLDYHKFFVDNISSSDIVLDIGCGNGALSFSLAKKAKKVIGIDLEPKNIAFAKERHSAHNIEYLLGDAVKDLPNQRFNVVVLSNVLEHIENRVEFLTKIKNIAPKILIRAPMFTRDWLTLYKKELGVEYRLDKTHFVEYTIDGLQKELKTAGLTLTDYSVQFGEIWGIVGRYANF